MDNQKNVTAEEVAEALTSSASATIETTNASEATETPTSEATPTDAPTPTPLQVFTGSKEIHEASAEFMSAMNMMTSIPLRSFVIWQKK